MTYAPASAIWFATYELLKSKFHQYHHEPPKFRLLDYYSAQMSEGSWFTAIHLVCGAIAGLASAVITNPFDVVKTRIQTLDIANPTDAAMLK